MNNFNNEEAGLGEWLANACANLGVVCVRDYSANGICWPVFLPNFGGVNGMVVGTIDADHPVPSQLYCSLMNPRTYVGSSP
jgi:hypothetical protein